MSMHTNAAESLVLPEGGLAGTVAGELEASVLEALEVLVTIADEHLGVLNQLKVELSWLRARGGDVVTTDLPVLAVGGRDVGDTSGNVEGEDLWDRLVALDDTRWVGAEETMLTTEDEAWAVDDLPDVLGVLIGRAGASGSQTTVLLGGDVLAVGSLDGNLGAEPLDVEPFLGAALLGVGVDGAILADGPEDVLVGAERPLLGGLVDLDLEVLGISDGVLVGGDLNTSAD